MKIGGEVPAVSAIYGKQKNVSKTERTSVVTSKKDTVSLSTQAKDFQTAIKAAKEVPDIRQDKVNEVLKKFESGSYDVKGSEVIDKVAKSLIDRKV